MEGERFLTRMPLARQALVQTRAQLGFPLGIILLGTAAQIFCQFHPLVGREGVHHAFKL